MSLESKIEQLSKTIEALIAEMRNVNTNVATPTIAVEAPAPVATPAPVEQVVEVSAPVAEVPTTSEMPAAPSFEAPAPAAPSNAAPFSDGPGLIAYVMESYKTLGADKGAQIQGVLTGLGYSNINDVKPEHYNDLFAGIEGLK